MRYLGIDYGAKYLGLAVGDDDSYLALPFDTIAETDMERQLDQISQLVLDEGIDTVVIGFPITLGGEKSEQSYQTMDFIEELTGRVSIPVMREDERLTSKLGLQLQREFPGGKYDDHALAAVSILQVYLEKQKK